MAFLDGCLADDLVSRRGAKIVFDLGFQGQLVALQGEHEVGLVGDDLVDDRNLTAHGVDRHQRAFELLGLGEVIEKLRDGRDFVGLFRHAELRQREPGIAGISAQRMKRLQPLGLVVRPPRRPSP